MNPTDFSAVFTGLLVAPLTDAYYFHVKTDGGVSIKINGQTILDHFMSDPFLGWKGSEWGQIVKSNKINMNSGMQYKFEIKYWRTPSHEFKVENKSYL